VQIVHVLPAACPTKLELTLEKLEIAGITSLMAKERPVCHTLFLAGETKGRELQIGARACWGRKPMLRLA